MDLPIVVRSLHDGAQIQVKDRLWNGRWVFFRRLVRSGPNRMNATELKRSLNTTTMDNRAGCTIVLLPFKVALACTIVGRAQSIGC
jgi:hypothetical protein